MKSSKRSNLVALADFANVYGDFQAACKGGPNVDFSGVDRFLSRWPDFFRSKEFRPLNIFEDSPIVWGQWGFTDPTNYRLILLDWREALRAAWRRHDPYPAWHSHTEPLDFLLKIGGGRYIPDLSIGRVRYESNSIFQDACFQLLELSNRLKVCANLDCPAPYFIADRSSGRYCSPDCLTPFQREWKRDWWNREGKKRRVAKQRRSRKKGRRK